MLVCHCHRISDRDLKRFAKRGCKQTDDLAGLCPAGSSCGGCRSLVDEVLSKESRNRGAGGEQPNRAPVAGRRES